MGKKAKAGATDAAKTTDYSTYFDANPKADTLYVTSDEQVFTNEGWAKSHAKFLEDKTLTEISRDAEDGEDDQDEAPAA